MRGRSLGLLLMLAGCGAPAEVPGDPRLDQTVLQPTVKPPAVERADPGAIRPFVAPPRVLEPDTRLPVQVDVFTQSRAVIDILWVVDDSGSMADERDLIADNFPRFLDRVIASQADFRMGVTTTNVNDRSGNAANGKLRGKFIDATTVDPQAEFRIQLTFDPMTRTRNEQGFEAARRAFSNEVNPGFLRPEAALAVIFLSDEDDGSFGKPEHFVRFFRSLKGPGNERRVTVSAITGLVPDGCTRPGEESVLGGVIEPAVRYAAVVKGLAGATGSICDADFVPTLDRIAFALDTLRRRFPLSLRPQSETIKITIDDVPGDAVPPRPLLADPENGWMWHPEIRAITFEGSFVPRPDSVIRIEYTISGESAP